jgi:hypothetical protein
MTEKSSIVHWQWGRQIFMGAAVRSSWGLFSSKKAPHLYFSFSLKSMTVALKL